MLTFSMYKPWSNCSTNCHYLKPLLETHNLEFVFLPMYDIFESQQTFVQHLCEIFDSMSQNASGCPIIPLL